MKIIALLGASLLSVGFAQPRNCATHADPPYCCVFANSLDCASQGCQPSAQGEGCVWVTTTTTLEPTPPPTTTLNPTPPPTTLPPTTTTLPPTTTTLPPTTTTLPPTTTTLPPTTTTLPPTTTTLPPTTTTLPPTTTTLPPTTTTAPPTTTTLPPTTTTPPPTTLPPTTLPPTPSTTREDYVCYCPTRAPSVAPPRNANGGRRRGKKGKRKGKRRGRKRRLQKRGKRRRGKKGKKGGKKKGGRGEGAGVGECDCDKSYGMTEMRLRYTGAQTVDIRYVDDKGDFGTICLDRGIQNGYESVCSTQGTGLTDYTTNTEVSVLATGTNQRICTTVIHTSCSRDIVGTGGDNDCGLIVSGWKDGNPTDNNDCDDGEEPCPCDPNNPAHWIPRSQVRGGGVIQAVRTGNRGPVRPGGGGGNNNGGNTGGNTGGNNGGQVDWAALWRQLFGN